MQVTDLMRDRGGNYHHEAVPDKLRSANWRSMSGSLQMLLGTWPVIATSGGRNDLSLVKRSNEPMSDRTACERPMLTGWFANQLNSVSSVTHAGVRHVTDARYLPESQ